MMQKTKVLFVYSAMVVGGSTTSLLSLLQCLNKEKYDIDLLLYRNSGPLFDAIPDNIEVLPEAAIYDRSTVRQIAKQLGIFLFKGYALKALLWKAKKRKLGFSQQILADMQTAEFSRTLDKEYDVAIGYIEGWSDRYVASKVKAHKKLAWLHAEFDRVAAFPELECKWMEKVDYIVTVAERCREEFAAKMPAFSAKAICIENIVSTKTVRLRAEQVEEHDDAYDYLQSFNGFKIITVCRLSMEHKGLDRAVMCARALKGLGYSFVWYVVGEGGDRCALQHMINDNGVNDCFKLIGNRFNPYRFIKECDVFCMPSRFEGKPIAITESMMLGVPPVVTEYLSAKEQIKDGYDGIVVANTDDAILDGIKTVFDDTTLLNRLKSTLQGNDYGNECIVKSIEEVIDP
jgi:glycosyltransferase involved in cell wall biosynthesis